MADGDVVCRMLENEIACTGLDGSYISFGPQGVTKVSDQPAWNAGVYTWLSRSVWIHPGETQQRFRAAWPSAECVGDFCGIPAGEPAACPTHDPCFDGGYRFDADGHVRSWMIKTDASTWDTRRRELTKDYGAPKKALVGAGLLPTMTYTWEVTTGQIELSHTTGQGLNGLVDDYLIEAKSSA